MKNYNQPTTQVTELALLTMICGSINLGIQDETSGSGSGMAPGRGFYGNQQGLKYLI